MKHAGLTPMTIACHYLMLFAFLVELCDPVSPFIRSTAHASLNGNPMTAMLKCTRANKQKPCRPAVDQQKALLAKTDLVTTPWLAAQIDQRQPSLYDTELDEFGSASHTFVPERLARRQGLDGIGLPVPQKADFLYEAPFLQQQTPPPIHALT